MRQISKVLVPGLFILAVIASLGRAAAPPTATAAFLFRSGSTVVGRALALQTGDTLLLVEDNNHRLVITDRRGDIKKQIGSIGEGPGEFYYPGDLVRSKTGMLYVFEVHNRRIQIFDPSGRPLTSFKVHPEPTGMAVNSKGQILLGQPAAGALISIYSPEGHKIGMLGDLRSVSDFYGPSVAVLNRKAQAAINRINIACDDSDSVYVSFLGAPFWQKYSADGKLLFQRKIEFPDAERAMAEFATLKAHSTVKFDEDESAIPYVTTGMTIDSLNRVIFAVSWERGWIVTAHLDGNGSAAFALQDPHLQVRSLSPDIYGKVLAIGAKPGHNNEIYSILIPGTANGRR